MNQSRIGGFCAILLAFAAFIVALLAWLAPFSPIGPSPFTVVNSQPTPVTSILPLETVSTNASLPMTELGMVVPEAGAIRTVTRGVVEVEQVYVPSGSFLMGNQDGKENEWPVHQVALDDFWIDRTEVTNVQFAAFVADTGYETTAENVGDGYTYVSGDWGFVLGADWRHPLGPSSDLLGLEVHPVAQISWYDAKNFCEWADSRLPTEAEWEYAARGSENNIYPWGNEFDGQRLNFCDQNCPFDHADQSNNDGYQFTAPVGTYEGGASWIQALDMSGNLWEWVYDWSDSDDYERSPDENPSGPLFGYRKVIRGGAWNNGADTSQSTVRDYYEPDSRGVIFGFRCAND